MEHRRHQRPLLLGQPLRGVKEEVHSGRAQAVAARLSRGRVIVACMSSDRPFLGQHDSRRLSGFR
jgi:hypothetical protein